MRRVWAGKCNIQQDPVFSGGFLRCWVLLHIMDVYGHFHIYSNKVVGALSTQDSAVSHAILHNGCKACDSLVTQIQPMIISTVTCPTHQRKGGTAKRMIGYILHEPKPSTPSPSALHYCNYKHVKQSTALLNSPIHKYIPFPSPSAPRSMTPFPTARSPRRPRPLHRRIRQKERIRPKLRHR